MKFSTAYVVAFSIVQGIIAAMNLQYRPLEINDWLFAIVGITGHLFQFVFCMPYACNGVQIYEFVAAPAFILATFVIWLRVGIL